MNPHSGVQSSTLSETYSIRSDMTAWEDLPTLKSQATAKVREAQQMLHSCIQTETELENEQRRIAAQEEEIQSLREQLRSARANSGQSASSQLESKNHEISCLQSELALLRGDNEQIREYIQKAFTAHSQYKEECTQSLQKLEADIRSLSAASLAPSVNLEQDLLAREIQELNGELGQLNSQIELIEGEIQDKENQISQLDRKIIDLQEENENLAMNFNQLSEPPPEIYNPIIDIHPQTGLVSDVGSTGAWRPAEENKHASPDPFENLFHQSTGATSQQFREEEEPSMPPQDDSEVSENNTHQDFNREENGERTPGRSFEEEEKEIGTPRREDALSSRASRTSTPPRVIYERNNSPNTHQTSQRVHNLTQLSNPTHYSIPRNDNSFDANDFFNEMQREIEERRKKQHSNLPRNFFE